MQRSNVVQAKVLELLQYVHCLATPPAQFSISLQLLNLITNKHGPISCVLLSTTID